jgi:hypothetical protein
MDIAERRDVMMYKEKPRRFVKPRIPAVRPEKHATSCKQ